MLTWKRLTAVSKNATALFEDQIQLEWLIVFFRTYFKSRRASRWQAAGGKGTLLKGISELEVSTSVKLCCTNL